MNTIFNNMLVQAKIQDMLEQAAEARANRKAQKGSWNFGAALIVGAPFVLWILWALVTG